MVFLVNLVSVPGICSQASYVDNQWASKSLYFLELWLFSKTAGLIETNPKLS